MNVLKLPDTENNTQAIWRIVAELDKLNKEKIKIRPIHELAEIQQKQIKLVDELNKRRAKLNVQ